MPATLPVPDVPGSWPVAGHLPRLARRPLDFLTSLADHGDLVRIRLGHKPVYVATHPDLVRTLLVTDAHAYTRGIGHAKALSFIGPILVATTGEPHRRQRRMMQPCFHRQRLGSYVAAMSAAATETAESWSAHDVVDVLPVMTDLATAAIAKSLFFSERAAHAEAELRKVGNAILQVARMSAILPGIYRRLPTPGNRQLPPARAIIEETIATYRAEGRDHGDMLSTLLRTTDAEGIGLTDEEIRDEIMGLAITGIGGPAAITSWIFHELGQNPDLERRLHDEIDTALDGRPPGHRDLNRLPFTQRLVKEALRKYPGWVGARRTRQPVRLGGHELPAASEVMYSAYALQNDPRWYPEPQRFDPDRWDPERNAGRVKKGAWVPFAGGVYKCIGDAFTETEAAVAVAVIASRWRLRPVPGRSVRAVHQSTHVIPGKLRMIAEPRNRNVDQAGRSAPTGSVAPAH
ncbi:MULTISPECIES: cytochrome P450 [Streptomyces]|uniref:Cytochrome P450 n=1 Tax=Streptomyces lonegramiae TaxID=3075524 RepID=A0ABU2XXF1_9ACTN|nr:cytochrome P450 [Streptomyces sp. DSM 41529]MDT0550200.1 cytochrome P450 [Streptomyces sp. DSM 41529]